MANFCQTRVYYFRQFTKLEYLYNFVIIYIFIFKFYFLNDTTEN